MAMRMLIASTVLAFLAAVTLAGCASGPNSADLPMTTIVVDEDGIHPAAEIGLGQYGSVLWLNGFRDGQKIRVTVDRPVGASEPCVTRLGFEDVEGRATSPELEVNHGSVLCFHETGPFTYEVAIGDRRLTGRILVAMEDR